MSGLVQHPDTCDVPGAMTKYTDLRKQVRRLGITVTKIEVLEGGNGMCVLEVET